MPNNISRHFCNFEHTFPQTLLFHQSCALFSRSRNTANAPVPHRVAPSRFTNQTTQLFAMDFSTTNDTHWDAFMGYDPWSDAAAAGFEMQDSELGEAE